MLIIITNYSWIKICVSGYREFIIFLVIIIKFIILGKITVKMM